MPHRNAAPLSILLAVLLLPALGGCSTAAVRQRTLDIVQPATRSYELAVWRWMAWYLNASVEEARSRPYQGDDASARLTRDVYLLAASAVACQDGDAARPCPAAPTGVVAFRLLAPGEAVPRDASLPAGTSQPAEGAFGGPFWVLYTGSLAIARLSEPDVGLRPEDYPAEFRAYLRWAPFSSDPAEHLRTLEAPETQERFAAQTSQIIIVR